MILFLIVPFLGRILYLFQVRKSTSYIYNRLCQSVGQSVGWSVGNAFIWRSTCTILAYLQGCIMLSGIWFYSPPAFDFLPRDASRRVTKSLVFLTLKPIKQYILGFNSVKLCCGNYILPFGTAKSVKSSKLSFFLFFKLLIFFPNPLIILNFIHAWNSRHNHASHVHMDAKYSVMKRQKF